MNVFFFRAILICKQKDLGGLYNQNENKTEGRFRAMVGSENRAKLFVAENFPLNGLHLSRSICPVQEREINSL